MSPTPKPRPSRLRAPSAAILIVALAALCAPPGARSATTSGVVTFAGTTPGDRSAAELEAAILGAGPGVSAGFLSRTDLVLFVAEDAATWDKVVAPALVAALASGPEAVRALPARLAGPVATAGPAIAGARVTFELPGERGQGVLALHLPLLLDRGKGDKELLHSIAPNLGLFGAGVQVEPARGATVVESLYLPSRPKGMARGRAPDVEPRPLPGAGKGDLVIFNGRGASGDEGRALARDVSALANGGSVQAALLRPFPEGRENLVGELLSFRVDEQALVTEGGWYRTLASEPRGWTFADHRGSHPVRYLSFTVPVAIGAADGAATTTLVMGGVALYAPLLLSPAEAPAWLGIAPAVFYAAVHAGEVPFLRDRDLLWFHRAHLDRWAQRNWRTGGGKGMSLRSAPERIRELARKARSRTLDRSADRPVPARFEPAPSDDRPEDAAPVRSRVFDDDLRQWLRLLDPGAEIDGSKPSLALHDAQDGAAIAVSLGARPASKTASASTTDATSKPAATSAPVAAAKPRRGGAPLLDVTDVFTLMPTCTPGEPVVGAVSFVLDHIPKGEEANLTLDWSLSGTGSKALVKFSASVVRGAGEHEIHLEAGCPADVREARFEAMILWTETGLQDSGAAVVRVDG